MNLLPFHWLTGRLAFADWQQLLAVGVDRRVRNRPVGIGGAVAIHAGLCSGDRGMGRLIDCRVTVAAIHLEFANMDLVAKRHRLLRCVADIRGVWRGAIGNDHGRIDDAEKHENRGKRNRAIDPVGEMKAGGIGHGCGRVAAGGGSSCEIAQRVCLVSSSLC